MRNQRRISITVSPELADDLEVISQRLGVSRSAIISELLADPLSAYSRQLSLFPDLLPDTEPVRLRGESESVVRNRLSILRGIVHASLAR